MGLSALCSCLCAMKQRQLMNYVSDCCCVSHYLPITDVAQPIRVEYGFSTVCDVHSRICYCFEFWGKVTQAHGVLVYHFYGRAQKFDLDRLTKLRFLAKWHKHLNWSWLNLWLTQMDMRLFPKIYMIVRGICFLNVTGNEVPSFIDETLGSSPCYWLNVRMQSAHLNIWTNNQRYLSNLKMPKFI